MDIIYVLNDLSLGETGTTLQVWGGGGTGLCQELIAVQTEPQTAARLLLLLQDT